MTVNKTLFTPSSTHVTLMPVSTWFAGEITTSKTNMYGSCMVASSIWLIFQVHESICASYLSLVCGRCFVSTPLEKAQRSEEHSGSEWKESWLKVNIWGFGKESLMQAMNGTDCNFPKCTGSSDQSVFIVRAHTCLEAASQSNLAAWRNNPKSALPQTNW